MPGKRKRKLTWSQDAREQWVEILRFYTKRNGSPNYSRYLNKRLLAVIRMFRDWPEIGEVTNGNENYRRHAVEHYAVFYRLTADGIEIAEIRDSRRGEE